MKVLRTILMATLAATIGGSLLGCERISTSHGVRGASLRSTAVRIGETRLESRAATKQEIVEAALDELNGRQRDCCFRVFVSLDDLLATCPDIAEAAERQRQLRASRMMSVAPAADQGPLWSPECHTVLAVHGDVPLRSADCQGGFVQLDDIVTSFFANGQHYQVTLRGPYLCNGQVYGYVDAPVWGDTPAG